MNSAPQFPRGKCWLVIGPRGSGKSKFAETQLMGIAHSIVIDTKRDFEFADPAPRYHIEARTFDEVVKRLQWIEVQEPGTHFYGAPVIFKVPGNAVEQRQIADQVARVAMVRKNTQLYYDELSQAVPGANYELLYPYFQSAVQQGRSFGVGVGASTQRARRIPVISYSESEFTVAFYLRNADDRKHVESFMGEVPWKALAREKHSYVIATDETAQDDAELEPHRLILP